MVNYGIRIKKRSDLKEMAEQFLLQKLIEKSNINTELTVY